MIERLSLYFKKLLFPLAIVITGFLFVLKGIAPDEASKIAQTDGFLYGGMAILVMGVLTVLYVLEFISRSVHLILMIVLLGATVFLTMQTVTSVNDTIAQIEKKKITDAVVKQGLLDLMEIQQQHKKKYGLYANDFNSLKRFLLNDSLYDIKPSGGVPDGRITPEHAQILGYDAIKDEIKIEAYDEAEALKVGVLKYDTSWIPVVEVLFTGKLVKDKAREFPFNHSQMEKVPHNEKGDLFFMKADTLDNGNPVILIKDPHPYDPFKTKDTLSIGSLKSVKLTGSWIK